MFGLITRAFKLMMCSLDIRLSSHKTSMYVAVSLRQHYWPSVQRTDTWQVIKIDSRHTHTHEHTRCGDCPPSRLFLILSNIRLRLLLRQTTSTPIKHLVNLHINVKLNSLFPFVSSCFCWPVPWSGINRRGSCSLPCSMNGWRHVRRQDRSLLSPIDNALFTFWLRLRSAINDWKGRKLKHIYVSW